MREYYTIEGILERIVFFSEETNFTAARLECPSIFCRLKISQPFKR